LFFNPRSSGEKLETFAVAVDIQHGQRLGLDVARRQAVGTEHARQREVDFAQELHPAARPRAVPEVTQEGAIACPQLGPPNSLGDVNRLRTPRR